MEDSNGVRRDAAGRVLGCDCAEHGEECGQCMKAPADLSPREGESLEAIIARANARSAD